MRGTEREFDERENWCRGPVFDVPEDRSVAKEWLSRCLGEVSPAILSAVEDRLRILQDLQIPTPGVSQRSD